MFKIIYFSNFNFNAGKTKKEHAITFKKADKLHQMMNYNITGCCQRLGINRYCKLLNDRMSSEMSYTAEAEAKATLYILGGMKG